MIEFFHNKIDKDEDWHLYADDLLKCFDMCVKLAYVNRPNLINDAVY